MVACRIPAGRGSGRCRNRGEPRETGFSAGSVRTWLGVAKAAGAVGLLLGLAVLAVGAAAAVGLVLYFAGAVVDVLRARAYAHVAFPLVYAAPVVASLALTG
ncbi:DoxX family protein [Streptomyces sp. NPDC091268]|uniref:DoxX family protein n=1 Tax=Streptomyces sp. NPDC091268 TaxID=3365979 RepID=UPI003811EB58